MSTFYGSTPETPQLAPKIILEDKKSKIIRYLFATAAALLTAGVLFAAGRHYNHNNSLRPSMGWTNPTKLHYHVYVIRHAEMKYQAVHKCNPPQVPMLSANIGYCATNNWGDNRCGGDFLIEAGHVRARCIVETVPFDGLQKVYAQDPGTCDDPVPKVKREYQTVLPIALSYNLPIDVRFSRDEEVLAADDIVRNSTLRDQLCSVPGEVGAALMCWNHENLPLLLQALGCQQKPLCTEPLQQTEYDMVYKIKLACSDGAYMGITQYHQNCNTAKPSSSSSGN